MIKKIVFLLPISLAVLMMMTCSTTSEKEVKEETVSSDMERMAWWREAKFGLFIHWVYMLFLRASMGIITTMANGLCTTPGFPLLNTRNTPNSSIQQNIIQRNG